MKLSLIFCTLFFSIALTRAIAAPTEMENRKSYAKELVKTLELEKKVEHFYNGSLNFFKAVPKDNDPKIYEARKKANENALALYEKDKEKIMKDSVQGLEDQFSSKFTAVELKYLLDITKYQVYKKFSTLQESEQFVKATSNPFIVAKAYLDEQKKKLGVPLTPMAPVKVRPAASQVQKH